MDISRCLLVTGTMVMHSLKLASYSFILQVLGVACNEWCGVVRVS